MRRSIIRGFSVLVLLFLVGLSAAFAAGDPAIEYPETVRTAREILWKSVTSGGVNSGSVAVMDKGKIVFFEGYGPADRAEGKTVDRETRFNIGSTSKMFAAVSILLLVDEGRINLDDPVVNHIPEFEMKDPRYRDITVRMLFNHSSGLPGSSFVFGYRPEGDPHETLLDTLKKSSLKHDPGAMGIYCNDGFTLAEMIVERISGKRYIDFLEERIFRPLGMDHTGESIGVTGGKVARFYDPEGKKYPGEVAEVLGAGGLSSTVEDLCRFADSFMPGGMHILSPSSIEEIMKVQPTAFSSSLEGQPFLEAFGWDYRVLPDFMELGYQMLAKSGGTLFYSTNLQLLPSERMAVAVIFSGAGRAEEATYKVMKAMLQDRGLPVPGEDPLEKPVKAEPIAESILPTSRYFMDESGFYRFEFDREKGLLDIYPVTGAGAGSSEEVRPVLSLIHNGGYFHNLEKGDRFYLVSSHEGTFLVRSKIPRYGVDVPVYQMLETAESPLEMSVEMDGTVWLVRNSPTFNSFTSYYLAIRSSAPKELPGYVTFPTPNRVVDPDYAEIAATGFRDQSSLRLFRKEGEVRAGVLQFVFSREGTAKPLKEGTTLVAIGTEGENEWLKTVSEGILSFGFTEGGRVVVLPGPGAPPLFDSVVDTGEVYVPEGCFIFLAGSPGDMIHISVR
ncbi:MAG TPA: serine hydrolase domain-containing protein [Synergistales bacterium]|nr:serine hydrolase domain-containing protein [Synergistales bacterium]